MRSDKFYKDGVLKGLLVAIEYLDDAIAGCDSGSSLVGSLYAVKDDLELLFKVTRDTPSYFVRDNFKV